MKPVILNYSKYKTGLSHGEYIIGEHMRFKIELISELPQNIPFAHQYQLQASQYNIIRTISEEYATQLHDEGFLVDNKHFKLFTFSKLNFPHAKFDKNYGFRKVYKIVYYFSTGINETMGKYIIGIFENLKFVLNFNNNSAKFTVANVECLPEVDFSDEMKFTCLSPICASVYDQKLGKHYLDYMKSAELERYKVSLKNNLLLKYKALYKEDYPNDFNFNLIFDPVYIAKRKGKIQRNIKFKHNTDSDKFTYIYGMEAPLTITAPKELIKLGYDCGFGEHNSAGFGMVEVVR